MLAERRIEYEREIAALTPPPRKEIVHTADGSCGAKTRAGTPCKNTAIYFNGRCRMHGGLSTGPKSAAGKRRVAQNLPNGKAHASVRSATAAECQAHADG
jgi:hypothetical protein